MSISFPHIDPIIIEIGPIAIRWYAMSYVAGLFGAWWYIGKIDSRSNANKKAFSQAAYDDFLMWAILGVFLGGRLGYVFFYNAPYYAQFPLEALKVWQGGMSFHGGLIGAITAVYFMCRRYKIAFWPVIDIIACATPIGLFFGRIANFINAELVGRATASDLPWGVIFPGDDFARHPSQLYEAGLEGLLLWLILLYTVTKTNIRSRPGFLSGLFLAGYASFRLIVEFFREADAHIGYMFDMFTRGQLLCLPMIAYGLYLMVYPRDSRKPN